jgi:hypothetical protein
VATVAAYIDLNPVRAGLRDFEGVGGPLSGFGLAAVGFGPSVIRRDPAVPTALLPRLTDQSPPPRARENRHRAEPADSWSGWLVFQVEHQRKGQVECWVGRTSLNLTCPHFH